MSLGTARRNEKKMVMQNLGGGGGGQIRYIMRNVRVANGAIQVLRTRYGSVIFRDTC